MPVSQKAEEKDTITQKKQRAVIRAKVSRWKKEGYNVSELENLLSADFETLQEKFLDYVHDINILEKCKQELMNLNTKGFEEKVEAIEKKLSEPKKAEEVKKELENFKKELMITVENVPDLTKQEELLRKELERIRKEEIERIRREELKKIRQRERERLIREAERRLRSKERAKILQEERERLAWIKALKEAIPERPKEKAAKRVKSCPKCGNKIPVTSDKRPLLIKCGKCGAEYTLKGKKEKKEETPIKQVKCPKCGEIMEIYSEKRPLKVRCEGCGSEFTLRGKKKGERRREVGEVAPTVSLDKILEKTAKEKKKPLLEMKSYGKAEELEKKLEEKEEDMVRCPHCEAMVPSEFRICGMCGKPLKEEEVKRPEEQKIESIFAPFEKEERKEAEKPTLPPLDAKEETIEMESKEKEELPTFKPVDEEPPLFKENSLSSEFPEPFITEKKEEKKEEPLDMEIPTFIPEEKVETFTPEPSVPQFEQKKKCPRCGADVPFEAMFCGNCGSKI